MSATGAERVETIDLSIVVPVYNEEESLRPLCAKIHSVLQGMDICAEIIFVDDGSTDQSFAVMEELEKEYERIRALRFRRNYRKAVALAAGFEEARGPIVVSMDADLQDDPEELPNLLAALDSGFDLVSGWKKERRDPLSKRLPSKLFNAVTSMVTGIRLHDFNCGLKAYRRQVTEDAIPYLYGELYRYLPAIAHWAGYRVGEIPVKHHPRQFGQSKFGSKRLLNGFLDLLTITFVVRFMTTPMHIFGSIGLMATLLGGAICAYIGAIYSEFNNIQHRHPLLLLGALLIILGVQFFSIGLLGDMLASLHQRSGRRPQISQRIGRGNEPGA
ncbi:MAG: glycosyltransferase [Candidatus Latescibacteria bacterium]|nr:glycosyltransferase [Candidatus Latescibacterota bacterium]